MRKLFLMLLIVILCWGCSDSFFYPEAKFAVAAVDPFYLAWEKAGEAASATYSLPNITISLRNETAIPANLTSISVKYSTKLGDPITQLPQYSQKYEITLEPNATTDFEIALYYPEILNFIEFTNSDIFPIQASIIIEIVDINNNISHSEANCVIYKPEDTVDFNAPVTTSNPSSPTTTPPTTTDPVIARPASIRITTPKDGDQFKIGVSVSFVGIASPASPISDIIWLSSPGGVLGKDSLVAVANSLSLGTHTISLSATVDGQKLVDRIVIGIGD